MSKQVEAMQGALETLFWANEEINDWRHEAHGDKPYDQPAIMSAITSLREALAEQPAQQKPLTDEQIEDLYCDKFSMGELKAFARAIEAAHNIKENT